MVIGKGFKPHNSINWILVGWDGYFESEDFGSLNTKLDIDSTVYDNIPKGDYKLEVRDDADEDYKLDSDGSNASVDVTIRVNSQDSPSSTISRQDISCCAHMVTYETSTAQKEIGFTID